jgi:glutamine cyclotransferase
VPIQGGFDSPLTSPLGTATVVPLLPLEATVYGYRVVNVYPHDAGAWVQGLVFEKGVLYEGTGLDGESTLRRVDLESGEVLQRYSLPPEYFGEGITLWGERIIQLTWKSGQGFVYDRESFELVDTFHYAREGWGITHDGTKLIMSDGTATLHFWDPETFQEIGQVQVGGGLELGMRFNELEYVQGQVYANIWYSDLIAMIDPQTGQVTGWIDLTGLYRPEEGRQPADVLNGIAYDPAGERLWVTGKFWPALFEIELVPAP